ncbi:MAG TPA: PilZ domain-containing protein [Bryobacteraceae bacterium]|nr:PilZ domain-containing protein [Bryobacteraceae bacterium]
MKIMIEQRKHQRFELRLPFEIVRDGSRSKVRGETRNVSSTGVLFTSESQLPLGEAIEYLITLPRTPGLRKDVRLRCVGKVLRGDPTSAFAASLERYEFVREPA